MHECTKRRTITARNRIRQSNKARLPDVLPQSPQETHRGHRHPLLPRAHSRGRQPEANHGGHGGLAPADRHHSVQVLPDSGPDHGHGERSVPTSRAALKLRRGSISMLTSVTFGVCRRSVLLQFKPRRASLPRRRSKCNPCSLPVRECRARGCCECSSKWSGSNARGRQTHPTQQTWDRTRNLFSTRRQC